jgi:cytochrome c oxidase cbb3-type subunit I/II
MWRAFDASGRLAYPDFVETVMRLMPMYWVRVIGGSLFVVGMVMGLVNIVMTWRSRPSRYEPTVDEAAPLGPYTGYTPKLTIPRYSHMTATGHRFVYFAKAEWHRIWERKPLTFALWTAAAVIIASAFEMVPSFLIRSNVPTIASVKPYTPLELVGRDIYVAEGCYNCHSQMVRPIRAETERYGEYSKPGEFIYDHPFQWGSRRIGPDLQRVGGKYPDLWHVRHMQEPQSTTPQSIMPSYPWLQQNDLDYGSVQPRVDAMAMLGVPYGKAVLSAEAMARTQAQEIAQRITSQGGPAHLEGKQIVALVAYLQRLGTDIKNQGSEK